MTHLSSTLPILTAFALTLGCGQGDKTSTHDPDPGAGKGGQGGAGATENARAGASQQLYSTDDEGVFPKDRVLDVQVTMPPDAWAQLITTARDEIWSTADVAIDGQEIGKVGFRPKGQYSLTSCVDATGQLTCDKLSFKFKFNKVDPEGRFYGLKRLVLNQITDGSALYAETLAYEIFNDFGITAPRTSYAVLTVNGESLGLYRVVEAVDGKFTNKHFQGGDGNLYKEAWPFSTDDSYFAGKLVTNEQTATNDAFVAFSTALFEASDDELPQTLGRYTDLDKMLDYMAVDYAIANWDGITTFYAGTWGHTNHNFFMYQSEKSEHFTLIPWDLNAVFYVDHWLGDIAPWDRLEADCDTLIPTQDGSISTLPASCDPAIRAIALSKDGYHASVQRLLDEVFVVDQLSAKIDDYARQLEPVMQDDPFVSYAEAASGANQVKGQLPILRSRLQAVLTE